MMERPIVYNLLHKDELIYEVEIRDSKPKSTVEELRVQIRHLANSVTADEVLDTKRNPSEELNIIDAKLDEVLLALSSSPKFKTFNRLRAVSHHVYHRFSRIESDVTLDKERLELVNCKLTSVLSKVDLLFVSFKNSIEVPSEQNISNSSSDSTINFPSCLNNCKNDRSVLHLNHKFDGKSNVSFFLQKLEMLCVARGISDRQLFQSAMDLFIEDALTWYMSVRPLTSDWSSLRRQLIESFTPLDYDERLMDEIRCRTQGSSESCLIFISILLTYFSRLSYSISESEKLKIIRKNLRPQYSRALTLVEFDTILDLKNKCRLLEHSYSYAENFKEPPRFSRDLLAPDLAYKHNKAPPRVEAVQSLVSPRSSKFNYCPRCRIIGHDLKSCTSKDIVCFKCGNKGVKFPSCSNCIKNKKKFSGKVHRVVSEDPKN